MNGQSITIDDIKSFLVKCRLPYNDDVGETIPHLVTEMNQQLESKNEKAILLAHIFHESGCNSRTEELNCKNNSSTGCQGLYLHTNGHCYHGRGLIQLTHHYNYKTADEYFGNTDFLKNPQQATDPSSSARIAVWFWKHNLKPQAPDLNVRFHALTKAINSSEMKDGQENQQKQARRYNFYRIIASVMGIAILPEY